MGALNTIPLKLDERSSQHQTEGSTNADSSCSLWCSNYNLSNYTIFYSELILMKIFQHLSIPDLARCSCVCQTWNGVAKRVKKKRTQLFWLYKVFPREYSVPYDRHLLSAVFDQVVACEALDVGRHYFEVLRNAPSEPFCGFLFGTHELLDEMESFFCFPSEETEFSEGFFQRWQCTKETYQAKETAYFLSRNLPKPNNIILCIAFGTVGTPPDNSLSVEAEESVSLSGVLIPKIPGVHMHHFVVTRDDCQDAANIAWKKVEIDSSIPNDKHIKCMIYLGAADLGRYYKDEVIQGVLERTDYQLAFGGANVNALGSCNSTPDQCPIIGAGLIFWGEKVSAASLVLSREVKTFQEAEERIQKLKLANFSEDNAYCLMFAGCYRRVNRYKEGNVEARAFRKVFPKVPLFGIIGVGTFGLDYIPGSVHSTSEVISKDTSRDHTCATVFVLISLGK